MPSNWSRRAALSAGGVGLLVALAGCASSGTAATGASGRTIAVGFNPGPYQTQFDAAIAPQLKRKGYAVRDQSFTDGIQVNVALGRGTINANIMQHPVYLDSVNAQERLDNVPLVQVPTPPMALFGGRVKTLSGLKTGASIALPNQPSNLYRALVMLKGLGWISLSPSIAPATAALKDVAGNPKQLDFTLLDNAQEVRALPNVDFAVVQGNFVVSSGMRLTDALALEHQENRFAVYVVVRKQDVHSAWAKDLVAAYHSTSFQHYITSHHEYDGYHLPSYFEQR